MGALGSESHSLVLSQALRQRSMKMNDVNTHTHTYSRPGELVWVPQSLDELLLLVGPDRRAPCTYNLMQRREYEAR